MKRFLLLTGTLGRARYLALGVSLFGLRFALDWTVARRFGRPWSPLSYLVWPDRESVLVFELSDADRQFGITLLALALPFIWIGVTLTLKRLRDAHLPLALVLLFFVPLVNVMVLLGLCLVPSRPPVPSGAANAEHAPEARPAIRPAAGGGRLASFWLASLLSAAVTVAYVYFSATLLKSYGFGVFVAAPFALGFMAAMIHGLPRRRSMKECYSVALAALALAGVAALALAFEGLICVAMAAPIALVLGVLGAMVGYVVQSRPWASETAPTLMMGLLVVMPSLMTAESFGGRKPALREVRTEVLVNAPAERVWGYVVAFPPLAEPSDFLFRTGVAYPLRAEIHGRGVGAVRHCVFSTGAFVEPIEVWDEPRLLAFRVADQPPPMNELSPFDVHPPHLDDFLVSRRGQFRLERLADGRTRLEGTTWYTNRMWPAAYWGLWSDAIIHRIHGRVLDHVRDLAEADSRASLP